LWDGGDRVEERTLTYRLPVGKQEGVHLCVYVYNPTVCKNGTLPIEISTVDINSAETTRHKHSQHSDTPTNDTPTSDLCVSVAPDNSQTVLTFDLQIIQNGQIRVGAWIDMITHILLS
jgi:hypothetical protein